MRHGESQNALPMLPSGTKQPAQFRHRRGFLYPALKPQLFSLPQMPFLDTVPTEAIIIK
jgi:hypothetical protein